MNETATRQYELVYLLAPTVSEQDVADIRGQIEGIVSRFGGQIAKSENWGRRRLAYEIQRHKEGVYLIELINGSGDMVREIDRRLRVVDQVIRHLVVRVDEALRVAEQSRSRRHAERARRRTARGLPEGEPAPPVAAHEQARAAGLPDEDAEEQED